MNHYLILVLIILGCGLLGGVINFFRLTTDLQNARFIFFRSILTGLGASSIVPLFLKMISSDLLISSKTEPIEYFVISGFCMISSIFSSKFIDSIGEKLLNQIDQVSKDVREVKNELEDVTTENELIQLPETKDEYDNLEVDEREILTKIYQSKYTYRSISGIASETYLTKERVKSLLDILESKNYVKKSLRKNNFYKWKLTEKGREIIAESYDDESSS